MAEGILTALQAALAGLGGGIEGAQQYRELERKRSLEQSELALRKRGLMAQMGATPIDDILPEEQGKVGPLAQGPAAPAAPSAPPSTMMQAVMQQVRPPAEMGTPMAPSAFGASATPPRPTSNVQRVMDEFRSRPKQTFREDGQRYALPRTDEERTMLSTMLQQAMGQDTTAENEAGIEKQARLFASLVGGDMNKGRLLARGAPPGLVGVETATALEKRVAEANIRQSDAAAAASLAARDATRDVKSGKMTERDINEQIAKYMQADVITRDGSGEETRRQKTEQEVRTFAATLRAIVSTPVEFPSFKDWNSSGMNPFPNTAPKK